jgi:hypothetical protein
MGKYIFSIVENGIKRVFIAGSANKAKKIRARYVPNKQIAISPIINMEHVPGPLPLIVNTRFLVGAKKRRSNG